MQQPHNLSSPNSRSQQNCEKRIPHLHFLTRFCVALLIGVPTAAILAAPVGTSFTYQGRLDNAGQPATGVFELRFTAYDAVADGLPVAGAVTNTVVIAHGIFTVELDFGGGVFAGANRWLEIAVRTNGASQDFIVLTPRQLITATPYAIHAGTAAEVTGAVSAANLTGTIPDARLSTNVAMLSGSPNFTGTVSAAGFSGNGAGLTNLNLANVDANLLDGLDSTAFWKTAGNNGTIGGFHFLGTKDFQALELKVFNNRGLRIEPYLSGPAVNFIAGFSGNYATNGIMGAAIGGGGNVGTVNRVSANFGTVSGGGANTAAGVFSAVGGGLGNTASGQYAMVAGGNNNTATGTNSIVTGGAENVAAGDTSFAAGFRSKANHPGTFVWGDATAADFASTADNQFLVRAAGGVGIGKNNPASALDVNGTITMTGLKFTTSPAAGAVLTSDASGNASWQTPAGGGGAWSLTGNSGTTLGGVNYLGTSDNVPVEFRAYRERALRLEYANRVGGGWPPRPNTVAPNVIGGSFVNVVLPGVIGGTIGGGGGFTYFTSSWGSTNIVSGDYGTISGGLGNQAGNYGVVAGGNYNQGIGMGSSVGGGLNNIASGDCSIIPGGRENNATAPFSLAAGRRAQAIHSGAFVWADAIYVPFVDFGSVASNEFAVRATGGVRFVTAFDGTGSTAGVQLAAGGGSWSTLSDRDSKENFTAVNTREVLDRLLNLQLQTWNYRTQDKSIRHMGPIAQDFAANFAVGEDARHISTVDADGVALAAIQGLNEKLEKELNARDAEIQQLRQELADLKKLMAPNR